MFVSSEVMTCCGCGAYGHMKSVCLNAVTPQESEGVVRNDSSSPQTDGEKVNREPSPAPTPAEVCNELDSSTPTGVGERVCNRDVINPPHQTRK